MTRSMPLFGGVVTLLLIIGASNAADDPKGKLSSDSGDKSVYVPTADVYGKILKVTDKTITFREYWTVRGLSSTGRSIRTATQHQDHEFNFTPDAHARVKQLPPKTDDTGKKVGYTNEELIKAKGNNGSLPGYQVELSQLKAGQHVEVHVVHIAQQKENLARWVMILDAAPPTQSKPVVGSGGVSGGTPNKN